MIPIDNQPPAPPNREWFLPDAHAMGPERVLAQLESRREGLAEDEAGLRLDQHGPNELPDSGRSMWRAFLEQFDNVLVWILFGALALSVALPLLEEGPLEARAFLDAIVILAILVLNAALGLVQEYRAEQALAKLRALSAPRSRVRRDGGERLISSRELVPGDVVVVEAGDRVAADGRLLTSEQLTVDESTLTGESATVDKDVSPVDEERSLAERTSMLYSGTLVTSGSGSYVVTATGMGSEVGRIADLVTRTEIPESPLQRRLKRLGQTMGQVVLALCGLVVVAGLWMGLPLIQILLTAVSLAVSAVPEGLPAVVTVVFALGVQRMARQQAIVRRLSALETLGSVTVLCADKTGTFTENRMTATKVWLPDHGDPLSVRAVVEGRIQLAPDDAEALATLALIAASNNHARLPEAGDPTELALLTFAERVGVERLPIDQELVPFTAERRHMRTRHGERELIKGAPEVVAEMCGDVATQELITRAEALASDGLRVLAFAEGVDDGRTVLRGLVGLEDPPRASAPQAVEEARSAGIRVVMITGDNGETARAVARQIGLEGEVVLGAQLAAANETELRSLVRRADVFARVTPEHKLRILEALQANGEIVAMTGDGVNDAPALKGAHVGVAMGQSGTEVAREAASIVLADDHIATMVKAIREGRRIYDNIRKFVVFLLRANFDEILLITTTLLLGLPLPYLPLHILWINLMTDSLPALALGMEPAEPDVMRRPPRPPNQGLLSGEWARLIFAAVWAFGVTLVLYMQLLDAGVPLVEARSVTLTMAILLELLLAQSARSPQPLWRIGLFGNRWMLGAVAVPVLLHLALLYGPLASVFHLQPLNAFDWRLALAFAAVGFAGFELSKLVLHGPLPGDRA